MENDYIVANIFRFWPDRDETPRFDTYKVPYQKGLTVLGLLRYIYRNIDRTLAFRDFQCGVGICDTCRMRINRQSKKSCIALLQPGETITIEPLHLDRLIRDLVTAFD